MIYPPQAKTQEDRPSDSIASKLFTGKPRARAGVTSRWMLRELPSPLIALILTVVALALGVVAVAVARVVDTAPSSGQIWCGLILTALGIAHGELHARSDAVRRLIGASKVRSNAVSVWLIAVAVTTSPSITALAAVAVFAQQMLRAWRSGTAIPHRLLYTGAAVLITTTLCSALLGTIGGHDLASAASIPAVAAAGTTYLFLPLLAAMTAAVLADARTDPTVTVFTLARSRWPKPEEWAAEITIVLVGLLAGILVTDNPWLAPAVVVLLIGLRRSPGAQLTSDPVRELETALPATQMPDSHDDRQANGGSPRRGSLPLRPPPTRVAGDRLLVVVNDISDLTELNDDSYALRFRGVRQHWSAESRTTAGNAPNVPRGPVAASSDHRARSHAARRALAVEISSAAVRRTDARRPGGAPRR